MKKMFKVIWAELSQHKKTLFWAMLFGILFGGTKSLFPALIRTLVTAWESRDETMAFWLPWAVFALGGLGGVFRYYNSFLMRLIGERVALRLRRRMMGKYLRLNPNFVSGAHRSGSGGLISRVINDINVVQTEIWSFSAIVKEPILIISVLSYLFYVDYQLTLFAILFFPTTILILKYFSRSLRRYGMISQGIMEGLTKTLKESLDGVKVVQSYSLENEMKKRFDKEVYSYLSARKKIISKESLSSPLNEIFLTFILSVILLYFGKKILSQDLKVEDFLAFLVSMMLVINSIKLLNNAYIKLIQTQVALERVGEIMNISGEVSSVRHPKKFPEDWDSITFDKVNFSFEEARPVLNNISLKVNRGEVIAIVGHSGAGKSTMVNLLERFCDADSGNIFIGDTPINLLAVEDMRKRVALVTQDVFLFSDTIEKNISLGNLEKSAEEIVKVAKAANAHEFILETKNGYQTVIGERGTNLSGGECQRISIARALLKDAPIIILDEATSALDSESEREVQKGLETLMKGRTAFVIAHRLSTVSKVDRIIVLERGKIAEEGSHDELMSRKGLYYKFQLLQ